MRTIHHSIISAIIVVCALSCKRFIEIPPPKTGLVSATVFNNDQTATAAVTALYHQLQAGGFASGNDNSVTQMASLSADEMTSYASSGGNPAFYQNNIISTDLTNSNLWSSAYSMIYQTNAILEGLKDSTPVSPALKIQLRGEAKFVRAFCYFYLVNLYGKVPLVTTTDYRTNALLSRSDTGKVYSLIVSDLKDAQLFLNDGDIASGGERLRPNKAVATALLARTYLYLKDWANAETQATAVIDNPLYGLEPDLDKVFLANSKESIWQLLPVDKYYITWEGAMFILTSDPGSPYNTSNMAMSDGLWNAFENNDARKIHWTGTFSNGANTWYYPFKYKIKTPGDLTEYSMVLRLGELYLVRAEARAWQDNIAGAQQDLNSIRHRAGLGDTPAATKDQLLSAVEKERRIELMTEWGHRWLDLKRTGRASTVLAPVKGSQWQATDVLYPIPESELSNDPNLTQNP